jgi:hypothetical protein
MIPDSSGKGIVRANNLFFMKKAQQFYNYTLRQFHKML